MLHVPNANCIKEIFKIAGLNAAEFVNRKHMYHCMCGKAEAILTSGPQKGRPVTFFIIGQNGKKKWEVQMYGNTEGVCHKLPEWNRDERSYRCKDSTGYLLVQNGHHYHYENFQVFNYSPIRIQLHINKCEMQIATARIVYEKLGNNKIKICSNDSR